jgi:hypothetical protein
MGCEADPRFETGGILGMLNGRMNGKRAILRLFDEARLDTGSIVDLASDWLLSEGGRILGE